MAVMKKTSKREKGKPEVVLIDVDGVLTTGNFFYTAEGKSMKEFSVDDHDALLLLQPWIDVRFVTGDRKGYPITHRRVVRDMKFPLEIVSTLKRIDWIQKSWDPKKVIYVGDGIFDSWVFEKVGYSICTSDGSDTARKAADYVTKNPGGRRAVAEVCLHILNKFFKPYNPKRIPAKFRSSGEWSL